MSKTEKRDLRARRTSDVHRYLTQFYTQNENSLKLSKNYASLQDVNKPHKENTNPLWKFLEKNLGLNSFASSVNLLTTVSTTSSNAQAKSVSDIETDSLNEGSKVTDSDDEDEKKEIEVRETQNQKSHQNIEAEGEARVGQNDQELEAVGVIETVKDESENDLPNTVKSNENPSPNLEGATSPIRQFFVKSITISSGDSHRSASPQKIDGKSGFSFEVEDENTNSSGSGSFESIGSEDEAFKEEGVDSNLEKNIDQKDITILGKLILKEESPGPRFDPTKSQNEEETPLIANSVVNADGIKEAHDDLQENETEIMQKVETLLQKTHFMEEESPTEKSKSISIMYTNAELASTSQASVEQLDTHGNPIEMIGKEPHFDEPDVIQSLELQQTEEQGEVNIGDDGHGSLQTEQPDTNYQGNLSESQQENVKEGEMDLGEKPIDDMGIPGPKEANVLKLATDEAERLSEHGTFKNQTGAEDHDGDEDIFEEPLEEIIGAIEVEADHAEIPAEVDSGPTEPIKPGSDSVGSVTMVAQEAITGQQSLSATPETALNAADPGSVVTSGLQPSEGNSEKDVSPIPTDSEKDPVNRVRQPLTRTKSSYELNASDKAFDEESRLTRTTSSHELVTLLKESLAKDDVVERIVSTLFQTVLRANEYQIPSRSRDPSMLRYRYSKSLSRDISYGGSSGSERDDSELFYEAIEQRRESAADIDRRNRRQFRRRGRNGRRRGTPKRTDDSSIQSTSTDNFSNRDENSVSTSPPADIIEDIDDNEREARRLLAEGLVTSYDQAELVAKLKALNFNEEDCFLAVKECTNLDAAVGFLQQECDLCAGKYCMKQMVSMLECKHICCKECAHNYFTLQITERNISDCVCPFCKEPDIGQVAEDYASDYFAHLDIFLKSLVDENTHELFQRKLRDRTLMSDPNFKWCIKCSSGFIANPKQKKLICPDCRTITCATCRRPWEKEHEKMTCEEFASFKNESEHDNQVEKHLAESGVTCPKCHQRYLLAKGGCMHLTCPHCKHEFCSGCAKPFLMGAKCTVSQYCERLGLHSHHPRNCLFYLRDKDPPALEQLLQQYDIGFNRDGEASTSKCKTQILKETTDGLVEAVCGYPVEGAGLCRTHYIEHLVDLVKINKIDPVDVMDSTDAVQELRRHGKVLPTRADYSSDKEYLKVCHKIIRDEIPLE